MFNFYVVLACQDKLIDAGRATTCRRKFKAPSLQTKVQKVKDLSKTWVITVKQFEEFRRKKNKNTILDFSKTTSGTEGPWMQLLNRDLLNRQKDSDGEMKKAFRSELLELCKTRTQKSSPNMLNFHVNWMVTKWSLTLAGLHIIGKKLKPHDYQQNLQKMPDLSKTWVSTRKQFEVFRWKRERKQNSRPFKNAPWNTRPPKKTKVYSDNYRASYNINSLGTKRLLKSQNIEKKATFPVKKKFGLFFLVISNKTNVREQLIRAHKGFWQVFYKG